jgi:hypothetical protein
VEDVHYTVGGHVHVSVVLEMDGFLVDKILL